MPILHRRLPVLLLLLHLLLAVAGGSRAAAGDAALSFPPTPDALDEADLQRAIEALCEGLLALRDPRRHWEPAAIPGDESRRQGGGYTALVAFALVSAGVPSQDPRLAPAIEWLRGRPIEGTYAIAARTMLWASLPDRFRPDLEADVRRLVEGFSQGAAGWDYTLQPNTRLRDNSIGQFATLALAMAAARGVEVPARLWELVERRTLAMQLADGGWNYQGRGEARGSMTAAGVATLFLLERLRGERGGRSARSGHEAILRGLGWLERHFDPRSHPGHSGHFIYWLYSLERAALAGGLGRLGERDWFREGAVQAIAHACEPRPRGGGWQLRRTTPRGRTIALHEHAMALLYLVRGGVPVAVGVLTDPDAPATSGAREMSTLTAWLGETAQREFNWLRVEPQDPIETWLVPALLWWQPQALPEEESFWRQLGLFMHRGGVLVGEFAGLPPPQRAAVRDRLAALHPGLRWEGVGETHRLRSTLFRLPPRAPRLETLTSGARDWAIASFEGDLSRGVALGEARGGESFRAFANLWVLAVETSESWPRLRAWGDSRGAAATPGERLRVARILHDRAGDRAAPSAVDAPEPLALPSAAALLAAKRGRSIEVESHAIDRLDGAGGVDLAVLSGVAAPSWGPAEWSSLRGFVEAGGTLLVETAGGRGTFTAAVERELAVQLGAEPQALATHPALQIGDRDLRRSVYRPSTARESGSAISATRLRGIVHGGRIAVITSRDDLSIAWLGRPREGVEGYAPRSALDLLEWALLQGEAARRGGAVRVDAPP